MGVLLLIGGYILLGTMVIGTFIQILVCGKNLKLWPIVPLIIWLIFSGIIYTFVSTLFDTDALNFIIVLGAMLFIYFFTVGALSYKFIGNKEESTIKREVVSKSSNEVKRKVSIVVLITLTAPLSIFTLIAFNAYGNPMIYFPIMFSLGLIFYMAMLYKEMKEYLSPTEVKLLMVSAISILPISAFASDSMYLYFAPLFLTIAIVPFTAGKIVNNSKQSTSNNRNNNKSSNFGYLQTYENIHYDLYGLEELNIDTKNTSKLLSRFYKEVVSNDEEHQKKNFLAKAVSVFVPLPVYLIKDFNRNTNFIASPRNLINRENWNYRAFKNYREDYRNVDIYHLNTIKNLEIDYNYCKQILVQEGLMHSHIIKKLVLFSKEAMKYEGYMILERRK